MLDAQESHHAVKVLRLKAGDAIELLDGRGHVAQGMIEEAGRKVRVKVSSVIRREPVSPRLDIATAIPKGPRADAMIEQLSQLGVDRVIPLRTARSVVDPRDRKVERFARAAIESAKQCGRAHVMHIEAPQDFSPSLLSGDHDLRLLAMPDGATEHERVRGAASILVLIGPEGGWTNEEIETAKAVGCVPWCIGPHVMRIETAAVAAAAIIRALTCP